MDDEQDLSTDSEKLPYAAGRKITEELIAPAADPDDPQWQESFLRDVATFRNAIPLGQTQFQGDVYIADGHEEFTNNTLVQNLIDQHLELLKVITTDSVSRTEILSVAKRFVDCVRKLNDADLAVVYVPSFGDLPLGALDIQDASAFEE